MPLGDSAIGSCRSLEHYHLPTPSSLRHSLSCYSPPLFDRMQAHEHSETQPSINTQSLISVWHCTAWRQPANKHANLHYLSIRPLFHWLYDWNFIFVFQSKAIAAFIGFNLKCKTLTLLIKNKETFYNELEWKPQCARLLTATPEGDSRHSGLPTVTSLWHSPQLSSHVSSACVSYLILPFPRRQRSGKVEAHLWIRFSQGL